MCIIILMDIVFDSAKNASNQARHGVGFDSVAELDWEQAVTKQDTRHNYGEERFLTYAMLNQRLHVLVWTARGDAVRPISLRKANARERRFYDSQ